jgi:hypothetical protein
MKIVQLVMVKIPVPCIGCMTSSMTSAVHVSEGIFGSPVVSQYNHVRHVVRRPSSVVGHVHDVIQLRNYCTDFHYIFITSDVTCNRIHFSRSQQSTYIILRCDLNSQLLGGYPLIFIMDICHKDTAHIYMQPRLGHDLLFKVTQVKL